MKPLFQSIVYILLLTILSTGVSQAQIANVEVTVTPDDFPGDIRWEIINQYSEIVESGSLRGATPYEPATFGVLLDTTFCYQFIIRDDNLDGIKLPGGFEVSMEGNKVIDSEEFIEKAQFDLSCNIGESCEQALEVILPTPRTVRIKAPKDKDFWFRLVPNQVGLYRISTCVNLISGQGYPNTQMWIYETCDRDVIDEGAEGAIAFSQDFVDCEPASEFAYFPLEADRPYYIRHRRLEDDIDLDSVTIRFLKLPSVNGCTDAAACNYNPYANIDNGSCFYDPSCAPDLSLDREELVNSILVDTVRTNDVCLVEEGCLKGPGPREVIRFSTKIDNIGDADYIVGSPRENDEGNFSNDNCHGHWHQDGYAEYLLFTGSGVPEPIGFKTGFCVLDLDCDGILPKYICSMMGITAGCSDIYSNKIECQWIDVTDIEDGTYTLLVRVNWNRYSDMRGFREKTFDNNWGQVCFNLDRSSGQMVVEVLEDCAEYRDCLGKKNGEAVVDCKGVCGGLAHFGDIDESGELTMDDVNSYFDRIVNNFNGGEPCYDLDGDNTIQVYDAALAYECVLNFPETQRNPFHNHCIFPGGVENKDQAVTLSITDLNQAEKYFDLSIKIPSRDIVAYQIKIEGVDVSRAEILDENKSMLFENNKSDIIALYSDSLLERSADFKPFLRVYYSEVNGSEICVAPTSEIINSNFEKIVVDFEIACEKVSSVENINGNSEEFGIHPNPFNDILTIENKTSERIDHIEILDATGRAIWSDSPQNNQVNTSINLSTVQPGYYILRMVLRDSRVVTSEVIKL